MTLAVELVGSAATHADRVDRPDCWRHDRDIWRAGRADGQGGRAPDRAAGIGPGDRAGVMPANVPEFGAVLLGVLRAGAVVVPMNPLLRGREIAHYRGDSGARAAFGSPFPAQQVRAGAPATRAVHVVDDGFADRVAAAAPPHDVVARDGDDTAVILCTSGTTGRPTGAEPTHRNAVRDARVTSTDLVRVAPDDVCSAACRGSAASVRPAVSRQRSSPEPRCPCSPGSIRGPRSTRSASTA